MFNKYDWLVLLAIFMRCFFLVTTHSKCFFSESHSSFFPSAMLVRHKAVSVC